MSSRTSFNPRSFNCLAPNRVRAAATLPSRSTRRRAREVVVFGEEPRQGETQAPFCTSRRMALGPLPSEFQAVVTSFSVIGSTFPEVQSSPARGARTPTSWEVLRDAQDLPRRRPARWGSPGPPVPRRRSGLVGRRVPGPARVRPACICSI